jgi:hypothetical protein
LYQQPRDRGAKRGLARLQRQLNLIASFFFLAGASQFEHAVDGIPKLRQRLAEELPLVGGASGGRKLLFQLERGA